MGMKRLQVVGKEQGIRCFLGVSAEPEMVTALKPLLAPLRASAWSRRVRWVEPHNWHLTLVFLGERTFPFIQHLQASFQSALPGVEGMTDFSRIELQGNRISGFPDAKSRIIALEFNPSDAMVKLKAVIDQVLHAQGVEPERRAFRPHLTLGRVRRDQQVQFDPVSCEIGLPIRELKLFKSTLTAEGSEYESLWSLPLS